MPVASPKCTNAWTLLGVGRAFLWIACGGLACSAEEPVSPQATTPAEVRSAQRTEPRRPDLPALPRAGKAELDIRDGRITVQANAAPRRPLLERLAWALEFTFDAPDVQDEPITVRAFDVAFGELLPLLFPHRPYRATYRFDPVDRTHAIEHLAVGLLGTTTVGGEFEKPTAPEPALAPVATAEPFESPVRRFAEERSAPPTYTDPDEWQHTLERLDDPDWELRVEAVERVVPEGSGLAILVALLETDGHAGVRAAAAEQLEDSETRAAVGALLLALQDPEPEVVLAAIDALEFTDDESIADDIRPLEQHADRAVREAARDAVCFISDCD